MKASVPNATYPARLALALEEISARLVPRTGGWLQGNAGRSVLRTFSRGVTAVGDAITTARTVTARGRSGVRRARRTSLWRVGYVWSALARSIMSLEPGLAVRATTLAGPARDPGLLVV